MTSNDLKCLKRWYENLVYLATLADIQENGVKHQVEEKMRATSSNKQN